MHLFRNARSRRWQTLALGLTAIVLLGCALVWFFPARWAVAWLAPRLHGLQLQQVHGLVWRGRADEVRTASGQLLGGVRWQVSRRVLLGPAPARVELKGPQLDFAGSVQATRDAMVRWDDVRLRADLALWRPPHPPAPGQPRGEWRITVNHALLQGGWPLQLDLHALWQHAAMQTRSGTVALGTLEWHASARDGVIDARVNDIDDGPLQVTATLQLSPLGWRLDARLRARRADPALQRWLAALGKIGADGSVHVQRSGGVASVRPAAPAPGASTSSPLRERRGSP